MVKRYLYVLFCSLTELSVSATDLPSSLRGPLLSFPATLILYVHATTRTHFTHTVPHKCKCKVASHILVSLFVTTS